MELELDLKITNNVDYFQSTDFRIAKDRAGLIFLYRETGVKFVLTAHLKGYKREDINIDINEDGTLISISGEKMVEEMAMRGWVMQKKEPNVKSFMNVFRIPKGVVLDLIKADYNDEETTLTIFMPKRNKGIVGGGLEEVKDQNQAADDNQLCLQEKPAKDDNDDDQEEDTVELSRKDIGKEIEEVVSKSGKYEIEEEEETLLKQEISKGEGCGSIKGDESEDGEIVEENLEGECDEQGLVREGDENERSNDQQELAKRSNKSDNRFTLCAPCFFIGSTLIASVVALFVSLMRSKKT